MTDRLERVVYTIAISIAISTVLAIGVTMFLTYLDNVEEVNFLKNELARKEVELTGLSLPLEDRVANMMEALSDNYTMKYDIDVEAELYSNGLPDKISITLHLKAGDKIQ